MNAEDIVKLSDEDLVKLIYTDWTDSAHGSTAQAELVRRQMEAIRDFSKTAAELTQKQTEAINRFNASSTRLAWVMIWLTIVIGVIAVLQLFAAFKA